MPAATILFMDHAAALGGAERILLLVMAGLDRDRFVPQLVAPPGLLATAACQRGVATHEMPLPRLSGEPTAPWRLARAALPLARLIRRERIAVVSSHSVRASVYGAVAATLARRPLLWYLHEPGPSSLYRRFLCAASDAAVAVSAAVADQVACSRKMRVIHNGIRWQDFAGDHRERATRLRAAWGVPGDAVLIGQVARLQPWKGQRDVLAAAAILLRERSDVYFAIVGGDVFGDAAHYERELRAEVVRRGFAHRVLFTGHQEDIPAVLGALDILVHASSGEPFGTILLEAGAARLPIAAYESGGVTEVLTHQVSALLVAQGDRAGLAAALLRLIAQPDLRRALGEAAHATVRERFDVRRMVRDVQDVLGPLVRGVAGY
jgi:glycosyltransferase involved in cell wall biosynthesis